MSDIRRLEARVAELERRAGIGPTVPQGRRITTAPYTAGTRVRWLCGTMGCSDGHRGTIADVRHVNARLLTTDPEPSGPYVAVTFDDRPGVINFHPIHELAVLP